MTETEAIPGEKRRATDQGKGIGDAERGRGSRKRGSRREGDRTVGSGGGAVSLSLVLPGLRAAVC